MSGKALNQLFKVRRKVQCVVSSAFVKFFMNQAIDIILSWLSEKR
jgi:hypothetical protein